MNPCMPILLLAVGGATPPALLPSTPTAASPASPTRRPITPPPSGVVSRVQPPSFQTTTLENGLQVMLLQTKGPQNPVVHLELVSTGGWGSDPIELGGQTLLAYLMAFSGTSQYPGARFRQYTNRMSAHFDVQVHEDHASFVLRGPARNLERMVQLMAGIAQRPIGSEQGLERLKSYADRRLDAQDLGPLRRAERLMRPLTFGRRHPYGRPGTGSAKSLGRITFEGMVKHRLGLIRPKSSALVISGAISLPRALELSKSAFKDWKASPRRNMAFVPDAPIAVDNRVHILHRPGSTQSLVCALRAVAGRGTAQAEAFRVAAHILAGATDSRLQSLMREQAGYTYGVSSSISAHSRLSAFKICSKVEGSATIRAAQDMLRELGRMRTQPADQATVDRAVHALKGQHIERYETLEGSVEQAKETFLSKAQAMNVETSTQGISAAQVAEVSGQYLDPQRFRLVIVGDAARLQADIGDLNRGLVVHRAPRSRRPGSGRR